MNILVDLKALERLEMFIANNSTFQCISCFSLLSRSIPGYGSKKLRSNWLLLIVRNDEKRVNMTPED